MEEDDAAMKLDCPVYELESYARRQSLHRHEYAHLEQHFKKFHRLTQLVAIVRPKSRAEDAGDEDSQIVFIRNSIEWLKIDNDKDIKQQC